MSILQKRRFWKRGTKLQNYYCAGCAKPFESEIRPKDNELIRLVCPNCGQQNFYGIKSSYSIAEVRETLAEKRP